METNHKVFRSADILLPKTDMQKWSVIACDQHTSEPEYWERVDKFIGDTPSTLRMMLPEHLYHSKNLAEHIKETRKAMDSYLSGDVFETITDSYVYVERTLYSGKLRHGLVGVIDLECYEHSEQSRALIRSTEGIVKEKMPPRIQLRDGAGAELSHVLVLLDDPKKTLIEPLAEIKGTMEKLYDFELMENGGHIAGYQVNSAGAEMIDAAIGALLDPDNFRRRYGFDDEPVLLFATGDGNHSLATAKECWNKIKQGLSEYAQENHPARFALVELVNIHDTSLEFEPINRVMFECDPEHVLNSLIEFYPGSRHGMFSGGHHISYSYGSEAGVLTIAQNASAVAIGALSQFFDEYLINNPGRIDYVHGDDVVVKLSRQKNTIGFVLPSVDKNSFFASIIKGGAFPRKTFSMGLARDKRYYLECRKL